MKITVEQRTIRNLMPALGGKSLTELTPTELVRLTRVAEEYVQAREALVEQLRTSATSKYLSSEELDRIEEQMSSFTNQVRELLEQIRTEGSK